MADLEFIIGQIRQLDINHKAEMRYTQALEDRIDQLTKENEELKKKLEKSK